MKKQNFIHGSIVLIASAAAAKGLGAIFRIPLANMLGGVGMGYFSTAYGIFMTVYALSVTGLPVAAAKLTAESETMGDHARTEKIRRTALLLYTVMGLAFTLLTLLLAYPFCRYAGGSAEAALAVIAIAPSVLFGCISALYRGYFEGRRNMYPTAVSQVIEGVVKLAAGLLLCGGVLHMQVSELYSIAAFLRSILPFDFLVTMSAEQMRLPLAAAAAVMGVTLSTAAGALYAALRCAMVKKPSPSHCTLSRRAICRALLTVIIPVAAGSLVTNLTSLIDLATITRGIAKAAERAPQYFLPYISSEITAYDLPNFFFGSFTGLAVTVFNLIPSFTNMFGKSAVPAIAEAFASGDKAALHRSANNVIFTAAYIAVPSGIGISVLAPQILALLFPSGKMETSAAAFPLRILGIGVIFLAVSSVLFAVLQAAGKGNIPVKIMLWGVAVKLAGNVILVPIPQVNVSGAALSTTVCYGIIMILSIGAVCKYTDIGKAYVYCLLGKMIFCGTLCGGAALITNNILVNLSKSDLMLFPAVFFGAVIYIISTHLMGILTKSTLKLLIC